MRVKRAYIRHMSRRTIPPKAALRRWRITVIRHKGERLGTVEAPDAVAAIKVAIEQFGITDSERQRRLLAQPIE